MEKMTYQEWRKKEQDKFNALPIYWAFSDKQFEELCERLGGVGPDDFYTNKELPGGFYLKNDADVIREYLTEPSELPERLNDYEWAKQAFIEEMGNHEYQINTYQGNWDVIQCFVYVEYNEDDDPYDYFKQAGWGDETIRAYIDARTEYYKLCDENGWW